MSNISINTQAVDVERIYGRSVMASFHGLWSLAGFFGGVLSALLVGFDVGVLPHYIGVNVFTFVSLLLASRYFVVEDFAPEADTRTRSFWRPTPFILFLGVIAFSCMSCEGAMFDWSVIFFRDVVGTPPDTSRIGFISFMSAMATGRFIADFLINRFGHLAVLRIKRRADCRGHGDGDFVPERDNGRVGISVCGLRGVVGSAHML